MIRRCGWRGILLLRNNFVKFGGNLANFSRFNHGSSHQSTMIKDGTTSYDVTNNTLSTLLSDKEDYSRVYSFILANLHSVNFELVQVFIYNLLQQNNTSAVTTLLHVLFKNTPFIMSNELWSCYINNVCQNANHLGAILIYHHLIDNFQFQASKSCLVNDNNLIPFLINPTLLQTLAIIFHRNKDVGRCNGILDYFKRFYSYSGHKSTYKSLRISVVEANANIENLQTSLTSFKKLASSFRGHVSNTTNWQRLNGVLKKAAIVNYNYRKNSIKKNLKLGLPYPDDMVSPLDALQLLNPEVYEPVIEKNVYTTPETHHIPLLNGSLTVGDLPYFSRLITSHVNNLLQQSGIESIIPFIKSNNSILHIFVVKSMCELGFLQEAFLILKKLPSSYNLVHPSILLKDDAFIILLTYIKLNSNTNNQNDVRLINDIAAFYDLTHNNTNPSSKVYGHVLSALLSTSNCTIDDIDIHLQKFDGNCFIYLNHDDYSKLFTLIDDANEFPFIKQM